MLVCSTFFVLFFLLPASYVYYFILSIPSSCIGFSPLPYLLFLPFLSCYLSFWRPLCHHLAFLLFFSLSLSLYLMFYFWRLVNVYCFFSFFLTPFCSFFPLIPSAPSFPLAAFFCALGKSTCTLLYSHGSTFPSTPYCSATILSLIVYIPSLMIYLLLLLSLYCFKFSLLILLVFMITSCLFLLILPPASRFYRLLVASARLLSHSSYMFHFAILLLFISLVSSFSLLPRFLLSVTYVLLSSLLLLSCFYLVHHFRLCFAFFSLFLLCPGIFFSLRHVPLLITYCPCLVLLLNLFALCFIHS